MARPCPACERPNSDSAARCLYCTSPLPEVAAEPGDETSEQAPSLQAARAAPAPRTNRHLVILLPAGAEALIEPFSRITGLGLYEARQHLVAQRPRLFRRIEGESEARALSAELTRAQIPHYVVEEASMLEIPISRARAIAAHDRHLEVSLEHTAVTILNEDLLIVIHGDITRERHHEERLGTGKGVSHRLTPEQRLHLYARDAAVAIEIEPDSFDWAVLGDARTASSLLNVKRFVERIAAATNALIDRGFADEPVVLSRADRSEDPSSVLAISDRGPDGIVWDNEDQFRYYARWRYRLERYLASRARAM